MAGLTVTLAGQDISDLVNEPTIQITSVLGQGAGAGSEGAGQVTTAEMVIDMGIATARGAGQSRLSTYLETVQADLPAGYWRMNSELACKDVSGHNNHGTIFGSSALQLTSGATGDRNPGWNTDGVTWIRTPLPFATAPNTALEALIYLEDNTACGSIIHVGDWDTGFGIGIGGAGGWGDSSSQRFTARVGTSYKDPASPIIIPIGQWVHLCAVIGGGVITYYVNSVATVGPATAGSTAPTNFCYIGNTSTGLIAHGMLIDEVTAHPAGPLSSSRISVHYGAVGVSPVIVRQGELIVKDATDTAIFGGYVTNLEDATYQQAVSVKTKVSCHDYWQDLDRVEVNELYTGHDDVYIIKDILTKYAPWIDQTALPASGTFTFSKRLVRAKSVRVAIQKIAAVTGYMVWVSPDKKLHYTAPTDASSAPFDLSDDPNFSTSFGYDLLSYTVDENAIINRVYFYGGKQESPDFVQDLFPQYNGTVNKVMLLAYYPHNASDGAIHIKKNGVDLILGSPFDSGSTGKLIADGGTAQVLINHAAETLTFDTSVLSGVTTLTATYRYNTPLVIVVSDKSSNGFYGRWYDGKLDDNSVLDAATAIQRSRVLLAQQAYGLVSLQIMTWQAGLQASQLVRYIDSLRGLNTTYQVQRVQITPLGGGMFEYTVDLGAWNWGLMDLIMAVTRRSGVQDDEEGENQQIVQAQELDQALHATDVWSRKTGTSGVYYSRLSPVGDGADAYCGFCTITS